jgi:hypothetical protein
MHNKIFNLTILTLALSSFEAFSSDCLVSKIVCIDRFTATVYSSGFCSREQLIQVVYKTCGAEVTTIESQTVFNASGSVQLKQASVKSNSNIIRR